MDLLQRTRPGISNFWEKIVSRGDEHRQARQNVRWDQSRTPKITPHVFPDSWLSIFHDEICVFAFLPFLPVFAF